MQTSLQFTNPEASAITATLSFYSDAGDRMPVALGAGESSVWNVTIPANGFRIVSLTTPPAAPLRGWVLVQSTLPLQVTGLLRVRSGSGLPGAIEPSLPSLGFTGPLMPGTVVSLANPFDGPVRVIATALTPNGDTATDRRLTIPANGRQSITAASLGLPATFVGSLRVGGIDRGDLFVAAAYEAGSSGFRGVPLARVAAPAFHWDRVWLVYRRVLAATKVLAPDADFTNIELRTSGDRQINAFAQGGRIVQINFALTDLLNESDSELAHVIGHELGHIFQQRTTWYLYDSNPEYDADMWGLVLSLTAGYDPYAMAGVLAKLGMVTGRAGLVSQFEDQVSGDAHTSFNSRIASLFDTLKAACSQLKSACEAYKFVFHPYFPDAAPLTEHSTKHRIRSPDQGLAKELP